MELIKVHNTPDGNFPRIPNPLLPECRDDTWCGHQTQRGYGHCLWWRFLTAVSCLTKRAVYWGLLHCRLLAKRSSKKIPARRSSTIHVSWNTVDVVTAAGGTPNIENRTPLLKNGAREDAYLRWRMSAHHYFRDFLRASGMIRGCWSPNCAWRKNAGRTGARPDGGVSGSSEISKTGDPLRRLTAWNSILAVRRWRWIVPISINDHCRLARNCAPPTPNRWCGWIWNRAAMPLMEEKTKLILELLNK